MSARKWTRVLPGLYTDSTDRWVITEDERSFWTVRVLLGWGPSLSGTMFPDYGGTFYGEAHTLAGAKAIVERWGDNYPENDFDLRMRAIVEGRA